MIEYVKNAIEKHKIIAIIRGVEPDRLIPAVEMLYKGGVRLFEVTFNQKNPDCNIETPKMIKMLCTYFKEDIFAGAGTVLSEINVETAAEAGAKFILSPNTNTDVIRKSNELNVVSIPGALTPSEIFTAYDAGASFIKIFPAGDLGVSYIKSVCSPLNFIPFLAVGGINENNMQDFLVAGVRGAGIGSNIVNTQLINEGRYDELQILAKRYTCLI